MAANPLDDIRDILKQTLSELGSQNQTIIDLLRKQVEESRKTSAKQPFKDKLSAAPDLDKFSKDWRMGIERLMGDRGLGGLVKKLTTFGSQFDRLAAQRGGSTVVQGGNTFMPLGQAELAYKQYKQAYEKASSDYKSMESSHSNVISDYNQKMEDWMEAILNKTIDAYALYDTGKWQSTQPQLGTDFLENELEGQKLGKELEDLGKVVKEAAEAYKQAKNNAGPMEKLWRLLDTNTGAGAMIGKLLGGGLINTLVGGLAGSFMDDGADIKKMKKGWDAGKEAFKGADKSGDGLYGKFKAYSWAADKALNAGADAMTDIGGTAGAAAGVAGRTAGVGLSAGEAAEGVVLAEAVGGAGAAASGPPGWVIAATIIAFKEMSKMTIAAVVGLRKMNEEVVKTGLHYANFNGELAMMAGQNEVRETIRNLKSGAYRANATKFANTQNEDFKDKTRVFGDVWHNVKSYVSGAFTGALNLWISSYTTPMEAVSDSVGLIYHWLKGDASDYMKSQQKLEANELNGPYANMLISMASNPGWGTHFMDRRSGFFGPGDNPTPEARAAAAAPP
jgi:hypothetical protein